jgi:hypothetical protein
MFKNATFLLFYFVDNQLFSNSETLVTESKTLSDLKKIENEMKNLRTGE